MSEPVVFSTTFDVLLNGPGRRPSPEAVRALQAIGVDPTRPLAPAYPLRAWSQALPILRADYHPGLPDDAAYEALGHEVVEGLRRTRLGQAKHERNVAIGLQRALERLAQTFRMSNNYLDITVELRPPQSYEVTVLPLLEFHDGVVAAGLPPGAFYKGLFTNLLMGWEVASPTVELLREDRQQLRLTFLLGGAQP
jgi:uncharacterized protein (TIGR02265 family)